MKGVTPLGFAAYMNDCRMVGTLLRDSGNRVAVDGMDTHGATPLMCAYSAACAWSAFPRLLNHHRHHLFRCRAGRERRGRGVARKLADVVHSSVGI